MELTDTCSFRDALADNADDAPTMTDEQKAEALSFLTAPDLFDRILQDFEIIGYTGEASNQRDRPQMVYVRR